MSSVIVVLALAGQIFMQGAPFVQPPAPAPNITVRSEVTVQAPPPDPTAIADASTQSFQAIVVQLVAPTLVSWVDGLLNAPDFIRTTDPALTYKHPAVQGLTDTIKLVALGLVALVVFGAGLSKMLGQEPSLGKVAFAIVMSIGDIAIWTMGIDLNNAITGAITAQPIRDLIKPNLVLPVITANPVTSFGPAVLVIVYAVIALLLLISMAFRIGLIDILICVGPLAFLCAGNEASNHFYTFYVRLALGTLFSQILVVIALRLAPVMGVPGASVASTLLGIVVLLLARQMPTMLASAGRSGGTSVGMLLLLRRVVFHR